MTTIGEGSRVMLHYRLVLEQGFVADSSGDEPLEFVLGDGTLEPGLERHLIGLEAGTRKDIAIAPGTVFPFAVKAAVQVLDRSAFPSDMPLEPGMIYEFNTPAGDAVPGRIQAVEGDGVTVDFNHPLAGQPFTFEVEIVSVEPAADFDNAGMEGEG
ncbi:FKBP-type peptidyl-prolyl cis-trans isomerase SlpA [Thioalkalivibrio nitratireducens DSM 14787]|uniref:Peptidyl-prolyl cis-trans isomerase n=1 Tax=Thioalkalivibrio nitratireducens (strain DSM 14787 / UNIQEM 213 / ALEN2) TaxID=1255043 RepID=L0DSB4_THIND|nr:peptidylprolyl isomerase [Thioalkalivibrio nitratireducens]AGA31883.1 FKBP-type peptidyl-prolyl cis-trans isomerase SlpA [Thioalkalivibrio nitratireducens DSM 14787]